MSYRREFLITFRKGGKIVINCIQCYQRIEARNETFLKIPNPTIIFFC
jgi:hypothetical protein